MNYKIPFTSFIDIRIDFSKVHALIREALLNRGLSDKELINDVFIKEFSFQYMSGGCDKSGVLQNYSVYANKDVKSFVEDVRSDYVKWLTVSEFHHNYKPIIILENGYGLFYRNGLANTKDDSSRQIVQRNGYMKKIGYTQLHFNSYINDGHQSYEEVCKMFGLEPNGRHVIENINPWLCFTEGCDLVIYFGEDKPVKKYKTSKICTKHKKFWAWQCKWDKDEAYLYWDVKHKDKLIVCRYSNILESFPELESYRQRYHYMSFDVYHVEPFRATDEYDYTSEERAEIIRKQEEERRRREEYEAELERRRNTPGYCECCGSELADYVPDPYDYDINNTVNYRWLCSHCYESIAGDI